MCSSVTAASVCKVQVRVRAVHRHGSRSLGIYSGGFYVVWLEWRLSQMNNVTFTHSQTEQNYTYVLIIIP